MPIEIPKNSVQMKQGETITAAVKILKIYLCSLKVLSAYK
jgi:hypothetical protein